MRKLQTNVPHENRCENLQQNANIIEIYTKSTRLILHLKINQYNSKYGQNKGKKQQDLNCCRKKGIDKIPHPFVTKKKGKKLKKLEIEENILNLIKET